MKEMNFFEGADFTSYRHPSFSKTTGICVSILLKLTLQLGNNMARIRLDYFHYTSFLYSY